VLNDGLSQVSLKKVLGLAYSNPFPSYLSCRGLVQAFSILLVDVIAAVVLIGIFDFVSWLLSPFGLLYCAFTIFLVVKEAREEYRVCYRTLNYEEGIRMSGMVDSEVPALALARP